MKRLFLLLSVLFVANAANGAVTVPVDQKGNAADIEYAGASTCNIRNTASAVLCASGQGVVYGVIITSMPVMNTLVLRDSDTANTTSSSFTAVQPNGDGATATGIGTMVIRKFPVPLKFSNGLSADGSGNAVPVGGEWTILYRTRTTN